jgi:beta-lactamase regulating signal transducer with metallopeptidase domain
MNAILEIAASNVILSALLAVVTIAVTRVWRSPQLAHGLWLLVLLKLVTPPLVRVSAPTAWLNQQPVTAQASLPAAHGAENTASLGGDAGLYLVEPDQAMEASALSSNVELPERPAEIAMDAVPMPINNIEALDSPARVSPTAEPVTILWPAALACVWLAGALVYVAILALRCIGFRRLLSTSTAADADITESAARLAAKLGLRRGPPVRMVEAAVPPLVWSLGFRPVIVLPSKLLADLSLAQRDALIAHELAHVRRRDDLVRWLEVIALAAFWWNPLAWFARRKLRVAEEECCDAWVVWALPDERKSYGEAMLATIEFLTDGPPLPALAGSTFGGSFYRRRIEMIMKRKVNRRISWAALGMIVLLAVGVLPLVGQTTSSDGGDSSSQPDASVPSADSVTRETQPETRAEVAVDPAAVETAGDAAVAAPSTGAVESAGDAQHAKAPRTDVSTGENGEQANSMEAILKRISRLEQLLQERSDQRGATGTSLRSRSPSVSDLNPSSDKREQDLQGQLLMLDVLAAKAEIDPARIKWERSMTANKKAPGAVSDLLVEQQRAEVVTKEIQLQRAETLLALHKRQVERKREESASQQELRAALATTRNSQLANARQRAMRAEELAQLKKLNEQIGKEIQRLEQLLKEEPDSPETWKAVDDFWKAYRSVSGRAAKAANNDDAYNRSGTDGKN